MATRLPRGYEGLPAIGEMDGWMDGDDSFEYFHYMIFIKHDIFITRGPCI